MQCDYSHHYDLTTFLSDSEPTAGKEHQCTHCLGKIRRGEKYTLLRYIDYEGDFVTVKKCVDCKSFIAEVGRALFTKRNGWNPYESRLSLSWQSVLDQADTDSAAEINRLAALFNACAENRGGTERLDKCQSYEYERS